MRIQKPAVRSGQIRKRNTQMKISLKAKRILCCVLTVVLLCASLYGLSGLLMQRSSEAQFGRYYGSDMDFDVLFFGASHMQDALNPVLLWQEKGISSYNMAYSACRMSYSYWIARNAFRIHPPKLVVIDCAYLYYDEKHTETDWPPRVAIESMPMSAEKVRAVFDLFEEPEDRLRYLFPFIAYHYRWSSLAMTDFEIDYELMGFHPFCNVQEAELNFAKPDPSVALDNFSTRYLRMLIEECQSRGIDVLLTTIPYAANEESLRGMSYTYTLAEEYGVPYLDADSLAALMNTKTDFLNSYEDNSHLNVSGAEKFSRFMAEYISENYDIPDRRADGRYAVWDSYTEEYYEKLDDRVIYCETAAEIITLLNAGIHSVYIELCSDELLSQALMPDCMENVGIDVEKLRAAGCVLVSPDGIVYGEPARASDTYAVFTDEIGAVEDASSIFAVTRDGKPVGMRTF